MNPGTLPMSKPITIDIETLSHLADISGSIDDQTTVLETIATELHELNTLLKGHLSPSGGTGNL
jgi:hypothetical protein